MVLVKKNYRFSDWNLFECFNIFFDLSNSFFLFDELFRWIFVELFQTSEIILVFTHFLFHSAICEALLLTFTFEVLKYQKLNQDIFYSIFLGHFLVLFKDQLVPNFNDFDEIFSIFNLCLDVFNQLFVIKFLLQTTI
jgi:hypothetical protein